MSSAPSPQRGNSCRDDLPIQCQISSKIVSTKYKNVSTKYNESSKYGDLGPSMNGAARRADGHPSFPVNSPLFLFLLPVVALGRGRLGHVDRIGGWEGALQPRFERPFEALATLVLVVLTSLPVPVVVHE